MKPGAVFWLTWVLGTCLVGVFGQPIWAVAFWFVYPVVGIGGIMLGFFLGESLERRGRRP